MQILLHFFLFLLHTPLQQSHLHFFRIQRRFNSNGKSTPWNHVAEGEVFYYRDAEVLDEIVDNVVERERFVALRFAAFEDSENYAFYAFEFSGVAKVREHSVYLVGRLVDFFKKQYFIIKIEIVFGVEERFK